MRNKEDEIEDDESKGEEEEKVGEREDRVKKRAAREHETQRMASKEASGAAMRKSGDVFCTALEVRRSTKSHVGFWILAKYLLEGDAMWRA